MKLQQRRWIQPLEKPLHELHKVDVIDTFFDNNDDHFVPVISTTNMASAVDTITRKITAQITLG